MAEISDQTVKDIFDIVAEARIIEAEADACGWTSEAIADRLERQKEINERESPKRAAEVWLAIDERRAELCRRVAEIPFYLA